MIRLDLFGDCLDRCRTAHSGAQMNLDRRRENARLEHIGKLAHLLARALERGLLREEVDSQHFRKSADVFHRSSDILDVGAVAEESADLDALLDLLQRTPDVDGNEA